MALTKSRALSRERWTRKYFTLASGNAAYKGGIACIDQSTGKIEPGHAESDLLVIGTFAEDKASSGSDQNVNVDLGMEIEVVWFKNSGSNALAATDIGSLCYVEDDETVTSDPTGASVAGRVWAVDTTDGVAVQKVDNPQQNASLNGLELVDTAPGAFASNDLVIADNPNSGSVYDVPATGAASTVTLPATAVEGTKIYFVADGTKNGHTVQYRDATGPANLTTALTASKRHLVVCVHLDDKWYANAYVSP